MKHIPGNTLCCFLLIFNLLAIQAANGADDGPPPNPYQSPVATEPSSPTVAPGSAEGLLTQLENISLVQPDARYRAAEAILASFAGFWPLQPTSTMPRGALEFINPLTRLRRAQRNQGDRLSRIDRLVQEMEITRLQQLDPFVSVPLLALADWNTLETFRNAIASGKENTQWGRTINIAEIIKGASAKAAANSWSAHGGAGKKTIITALIASVVMGELVDGESVWVDAIPPDFQGVAVAGVAVSLFAVIVGTFYWDRYRARRRRPYQSEAFSHLSAAFEYARRHKLPLTSHMETYLSGFIHTKSLCIAIIGTALEN